MTKRGGYLEVITGPMFAGKSTALLGLYEQATGARVLIKPKADTRSVGVVRTHDGNETEAVIMATSEEIKARRERYVFIDEGQFFDDGLTQVCADMAKKGHVVRVAGLDKDFRDQPFGPMPALMLEADILQKLWTRCVVCDGPFASKTARKTNPDTLQQILVGGADKYEPRCRRCFKEDT